MKVRRTPQAVSSTVKATRNFSSGLRGTNFRDDSDAEDAGQAADLEPHLDWNDGNPVLVKPVAPEPKIKSLAEQFAARKAIVARRKQAKKQKDKADLEAARPGVQARNRKRAAKKCDNCAEVAELQCPSCAERFCAACDALLHSRAKTRTHKRIPIEVRQVWSNTATATAEPLPSKPASATEQKLAEIFTFFCRKAPASHGIDNAKWAACVKAMGLLDTKKLTRTTIDLTFTKVKVKGTRRLDSEGFERAFIALAKIRFRSKDCREDRLAGVTALLALAKRTSFSRKGTAKRRTKRDVLERLTDTAKYTGAHKARFDDKGQGKGLAGRGRASGGVAGPSKVVSALDWGVEQTPNLVPAAEDTTDYAVSTTLGQNATAKARYNFSSENAAIYPVFEPPLPDEAPVDTMLGDFDGGGSTHGLTMTGHLHPTEQVDGRDDQADDRVFAPGQNAHEATVNLFTGELHLRSGPMPGTSRACATVHGAAPGVEDGPQYTLQHTDDVPPDHPAGKPSEQPHPPA